MFKIFRKKPMWSKEKHLKIKGLGGSTIEIESKKHKETVNLADFIKKEGE